MCIRAQGDLDSELCNCAVHITALSSSCVNVSLNPLWPTQVLAVFRKVFGEDFEPYTGSRQFFITPLNLQVMPENKRRCETVPTKLGKPQSD